MRHPKGIPMHNICPEQWCRTPNMTGLPSLDAAIHHNPSKSMQSKLGMYLGVGDFAPRTAYSGYNVYSSDVDDDQSYESGEDKDDEVPV